MLMEDDDDDGHFSGGRRTKFAMTTVISFFGNDRQHVHFGAYFNQRALPI